MADNLCDTCGQPLKPGDSIVFTPTDGEAKEKHLCMSCFERSADKTN